MFKAAKKILAISLVLVLSMTLAGCGSKTTNTAAPKQENKETKKVDYPTKAITVIHGFKPGGGSDQLAQLVKPFMEKILKQQFAQVYKPGADGAIAWKEVANTTPDGYTITTVLTPKTQLNSMINPSAGYKMSDFEPIANVVFDPGILVVPANSKFKTFQEFIEYAKNNPKQVKMAHSGDGGDDWFNAVMIEKLTGAKFNLIPFEGDGPAWQAAAGGNVDANTNNLSTVVPQVKGGKLRALAVYTDKRVESLPDVPTLKELGVNLVEGSSRGFIAPKGTPKEVIDILANALEQASKDPELIKAAKAVDLQITFMKGEEFKSYLAKEEENLKKVVEEMGLNKK